MLQALVIFSFILGQYIKIKPLKILETSFKLEKFHINGFVTEIEAAGTSAA